MRELKFKAWDNILKSYIPIEYIGISGNGNYFNNSLENCISTTDNWIVEQFTGLKDKNGKDVYEGDILEFKNDLVRHNLHKVFRVDGGLVINSHSDDICKDSIVFYEACADMQTSQWIRQCEIIGNIHQNPELINN